jgi:hypothetical protein
MLVMSVDLLVVLSVQTAREGESHRSRVMATL